MLRFSDFVDFAEVRSAHALNFTNAAGPLPASLVTEMTDPANNSWRVLCSPENAEFDYGGCWTWCAQPPWEEVGGPFWVDVDGDFLLWGVRSPEGESITVRLRRPAAWMDFGIGFCTLCDEAEERRVLDMLRACGVGTTKLEEDDRENEE